MMSKLPLEIKALEELEKLNVSELYGKPISELAQLSISRREGAEKLREAYESFSVDDLSAEKIESVGKNLGEAVAALKRAQKGYSYPSIDELQIVVRIIDAQLAEAETLQRSIDLWWQGQISAQLNQARLHLAQPATPESIQKGKSHLDEAKHLLERWKSGKEFTHRAGNEPKEKNQESIYQETQDAIEEVEKLLKENRSALVEVRMAEVEHWLDLAEIYLSLSGENVPGKGQSSGSGSLEVSSGGNDQPPLMQSSTVDKPADNDLTAIYAAMSCLSQAQILLQSLTSKHDNGQTLLADDSVVRAFPSAEQVKTLWDRYTDLSDKARQALRQGMGARRQQIEELAKGIEEKIDGDPKEFLKVQDNCSLVDELRYNLYLFPDIELQPNVKKAIMQRVENVQESRRILWQMQAKEKEKGTYWAYRELERAKSLNPGDKNIEEETKKRRSEWGEKQRQFSKLVEKVKKVYETYYDKRTTFQTLAENADQKIKEIGNSMQQLRKSYEAEGKPEAWQKDFSTAKQQADWIMQWLETSKQLKELVDNWKKACEVEKGAPMVDDELLTQTESFIEEIKKNRIWFPPEANSALLKAIEKALGSSNGNEVFANLSMVKRTFQLKEQLEKWEV